jgi:hypothetical protein
VTISGLLKFEKACKQAKAAGHRSQKNQNL